LFQRIPRPTNTLFCKSVLNSGYRATIILVF
jgi:hypothetical protein